MESREVQAVNDTPFAAFVSTYQNIEPFRICTDADGKASYHFHASGEDLARWTAAYEDEATTVVAIKVFVGQVRRLQELADKAHQIGGILTLR